MSRLVFFVPSLYGTICSLCSVVASVLAIEGALSGAWFQMVAATIAAIMSIWIGLAPRPQRLSTGEYKPVE